MSQLGRDEAEPSSRPEADIAWLRLEAPEPAAVAVEQIETRLRVIDLVTGHVVGCRVLAHDTIAATERMFVPGRTCAHRVLESYVTAAPVMPGGCCPGPVGGIDGDRSQVFVAVVQVHELVVVTVVDHPGRGHR